MTRGLIETTDQLVELVQEALTVEAVALDTEFVWERTYFPGLGLLQLSLGADREPVLIDAPAVGDLGALGLVLVAPRVTKLLHDGLQDLAILRRATGCGPPRNIFDTRLAAGFTGRSSVLSLTALTEELVGVALDKSETRTDWLQRPLSPAQLAYAADDVRYMHALWRKLSEDVRQRGNTERLAEELRELEQPALTDDRAPEEAFLRVKGRGRLDGKGLSVLRELAAWRELECRRRDRPRGHLLRDDELLALASKPPRSEEAIAKLPALGKRKAGQHGAAILRAVERGLACPKQDRPEPVPRQRAAANATERADALIAWVDKVAAAHGIDSAILASRSDLRAVVRGASGAEYRLLGGWRRALLEPELSRLIGSDAA